jgi:hypothetical protein
VKRRAASSTTETAFQDEILRIQVSQRASELFEFFGGPMEFQFGQLRQLEEFAKQWTDVLNVSDRCIAISISLSAMWFISAVCEAVVETSRFTLCLLNATLRNLSEVLEFPFGNLEVGDDRAAFVFLRHGGNLTRLP